MKLVKVFVCDKEGVGVYGKKVQEYGKDAEYTNSSGVVELVIEEGDTGIYVEGQCVYSGYGSKASKVITYKI